MEFYQENKRVLPVEIDYPHYYTRTLKKITIKRSLSKNLDKFNMDFKTDINENRSCFLVNSQENERNNRRKYGVYNIINYPLSTLNLTKQSLMLLQISTKLLLLLIT
jgi:hypothetical protein